VVYASSSSALATGSALTFDGSTLTATQATAASISLNNASGNYLFFTAASGNAFIDNRIASASLNFRSGGTFNWSTYGGSDQMSLTSTWLGIGTSSPSSKLDIRATNPTVTVKATSTGYPYAYFSNDGGDFYIGRDSSTGGAFNNANANVVWGVGANPILFATNNTVKATLDSAGNLGLGVTPSAWRSTTKAIQIGGASLQAFSTAAMTLGQNFYSNSSNQNIYLNTAAASQYVMVGDEHRWSIAPSGTAGDAISFTQAMTLDASGNLALGTTSAGCRIDAVSPNNTSLNPTIRVNSNNVAVNSALAYDGLVGSGEFELRTSSASALKFGTNATERARIDSSGNLIQTVNTTAATLTTNQTLTFSIVDNSTLRISVRGSDGTTRTATVALT
jgi:hypothetical protein